MKTIRRILSIINHLESCLCIIYRALSRNWVTSRQIYLISTSLRSCLTRLLVTLIAIFPSIWLIMANVIMLNSLMKSPWQRSLRRIGSFMMHRLRLDSRRRVSYQRRPKNSRTSWRRSIKLSFLSEKRRSRSPRSSQMIIKRSKRLISMTHTASLISPRSQVRTYMPTLRARRRSRISRSFKIFWTTELLSYIYFFISRLPIYLNFT